MELKDLDAGMKLDAQVLSRGVRENLRLDGALEAFADLEISHFNGERFKAQWSGLLLTRDGGRNSGTFRCLDTLGCTGDVVEWLKADFKPRRVQIVIGERPNNKRPLEPYKYVQWLNKHSDNAPSGDVIARLKEAGLGSTSDKLTPQRVVGDSKINDDSDGMPF